MTDLREEIAQQARKSFSLLPTPGKAIALVLAAVAALVAVYTVSTSRIDWFGLSKKRADAAELRATNAEKLASDFRDMRAKDQAQASTSYNQLQENCRTDVVAAIKGGRTIERVLATPPPVAGAPRVVFGADVVRDAFGEPPGP